MRTQPRDHQPLLRAMLVLIALSLPGFTAPWSIQAASAQAIAVYGDQLESGFEDWSWATHDLNQSAIVHSGTHAVSMQPVNWEGLYFHRNAGVAVTDNGTLELWVRGASPGGQQIRFALYSGGGSVGDAALAPFIQGGAIPSGAWAKATIPFSALGVTSGVIDGLVFQADLASSQPAIYVDDLVLLDTAGPPQPVGVAVDPGADRHAIDPLIYGVNLGSTAEFGALDYPLRRWGGNATTRYNWQVDATNHASDWFFINLAEGTGAGLPDNSSADLWVDETLQSGAEAIVTVPTIGWTAKDRVKRWGFSIAKYGAQQQNECTLGEPPWCAADAGNGIRTNGNPVTGNDPHDTSVEIGPSFVSGWLGHLMGRVGSAAAGGVAFYALDNEPMLWNSTHRDVHPAPLTYDELWTRSRQYAEAVKAADPAAKVLGPSEWGWCGYFYSAADGCQPGADMAAHGGLPVVEWYLAQNRARELQTGTRPVDYLDLHCYPQADGVALSDDESAATAALRLRSLKGLYDPSYVDESWIAQPLVLIPRMKAWIAARCPGMKIAITEYNWGNDQGASSTLAQAEALAIFGREGVDLATRWVAPAAGTKMLDAFRLYLDYDGLGHSLAGESVRATSTNVDAVGAYAIRMAGADLGLLLFNKATASKTANVSVAGGVTGQARLFRFDPATALAPAWQFGVSGTAFSLDLPARSATLVLLQRVVLSADAPPAPQGIEAYPTPFRGAVTVRFDLPSPASVSVDVCDAAGRVVRRLSARALEAGPNSVIWDGLDGAGRVAAAGVYFVRVSAGEEKRSVRVVRVE